LLSGKGAGLPDESGSRPQRQAAVLALQQRHGNRFVQRMLSEKPLSSFSRTLQREPTPAPAAGASPPVAGEPPLGEFEFASKSIQMAGAFNFNAKYTPVGPAPVMGSLEITLRIQIDFRDFSPEIALKEPFKTYFVEHPLTKAQKEDFKWTPEEKKVKGAKFKTDFIKNVSEDWGDKHVLRMDEPGFNKYQANVRVKVEAFEEGEGEGPAHYFVHVQKVPEGVSARFRSFVGLEDDPAYKDKDEKFFRNMAVLDYRDPSEEEEHKVHPRKVVRQIKPFEFNSADLTPGLKSQVAGANSELRDHKALIEKPNWDGLLFGRASAKGNKKYNEDLANRRAEAVYNELDSDVRKEVAIGTKGEENATNDEKFQRVDMEIYSYDEKTVKQNVASHEAGHMFGLGDEYVEEKPDKEGGIPKFIGDPTTQSDKIREYLKGEDAEQIAREVEVSDADSMMAKGSEVKKGHYLNFLKAINSITDKNWKID
jgi:outer membrane protein OmpA-like peptidoglycan-associated protein